MLGPGSLAPPASVPGAEAKAAGVVDARIEAEATLGSHADLMQGSPLYRDLVGHWQPAAAPAATRPLPGRRLRPRPPGVMEGHGYGRH